MICQRGFITIEALLYRRYAVMQSPLVKCKSGGKAPAKEEGFQGVWKSQRNRITALAALVYEDGLPQVNGPP